MTDADRTPGRPKKRRYSVSNMFIWVTSILGLLADLAGLATFLGGFWTFGDEIHPRLRPTFLSTSLLLILYGWLGISLAISRARRNSRGAVEFGGYITYPLAVLWLLVATSTLDMEDRGIVTFFGALLGAVMYGLIGTVISSIISSFLAVEEKPRSFPYDAEVFELAKANPLPDLSTTAGNWLLMAQYVRNLLLETYNGTQMLDLELIDPIDEHSSQLIFVQCDRDGDYYDVRVTTTIDGQIVGLDREIR